MVSPLLRVRKTGSCLKLNDTGTYVSETVERS